LEIVKKVYCDKALKRMQMAAVAGQRHLKADASIADIAAEEENDWQKTVRRLAQAYSVLAILNGPATLHKDLQLSKKFARWVTKLLDKR
jgi:hypothetical protein